MKLIILGKVKKQKKKSKRNSISDKFNNLIDDKISPKENDDISLAKISNGEGMTEKNSQKDSSNEKKNIKEKTGNASSGIYNFGK